jgi:hypothetical protein
VRCPYPRTNAKPRPAAARRNGFLDQFEVPSSTRLLFAGSCLFDAGADCAVGSRCARMPHSTIVDRDWRQVRWPTTSGPRPTTLRRRPTFAAISAGSGRAGRSDRVERQVGGDLGERCVAARRGIVGERREIRSRQWRRVGSAGCSAAAVFYDAQFVPGGEACVTALDENGDAISSSNADCRRVNTSRIPPTRCSRRPILPIRLPPPAAA